MNPQVKKIYLSLKFSFEGETWHGASLMDLLKGIDYKSAGQRIIPDCHTIWELVLHITNWRIYTAEKLKGNAAYEISLNSEADWTAMPEITQENWEKTLGKLKASQQNLGELLKKTGDSKLDEMVSGKKYSFYFLLQGIIQHDIYHGGQIALLKKCLQNVNALEKI